MLNNNRSGFFTDLWSLGCVVFEMLEGTSPFASTASFQVFEKVKGRDIKWPSGIERDAKDLIDRLVQVKSEYRIGSSNIRELVEHPFFTGIDFDALYKPNKEWERTMKAFAPHLAIGG